MVGRLRRQASGAIDTALKELPGSFPEEVVSSIVEGLRTRLRMFEHAQANPT
jgi:hypothetical protein